MTTPGTASCKTLVKVREWAKHWRDILDNLGPCITTEDGEFIDVAYFEDLEKILGTNQDQS